MNIMQRPFLLSGVGSLVLYSLLSIGVWAGCVGETPANGAMLEVTLSSITHVGSGIIVRGTIQNSSTESLAILKWHLPEAGSLSVPLFLISDNEGSLVPYTGILAKRPAPEPADFLVLKSGKTIEWEVNLLDFYQLANHHRYLVAIDKNYLDVRVILRDGVIGNERASISANEIYLPE